VIAVLISVIQKFGQLAHHVKIIREVYTIEIHRLNRLNLPLDARMGGWRVRNRLDLYYVEQPQFGEPAMKPEKGDVIGADALGWRRAYRRHMRAFLSLSIDLRLRWGLGATPKEDRTHACFLAAHAFASFPTGALGYNGEPRLGTSFADPVNVR
jgi:hypothetical protein